MTRECRFADSNYEVALTIDEGNEAINFTRAERLGGAMRCHERGARLSLEDATVSCTAESTTRWPTESEIVRNP